MVLMGYLVCVNCKGYYELRDQESAKDFSKCQCDGNLKYYNDVVEFIEENSSLEHKNSALKLKVDDLDNINSKLKSDHKNLKENYANLHNKYQSLEKKFNDLSQGKDGSEGSFSSAKVDKSLKDKNSKLMKINMELLDKYSKFESENKILMKKNSDLIFKNKNLDKLCSKVKIEKDRLEESFSSIKDVNSSLMKENAKLKEINSNLTLEKDKLSEEISELELEKIQLQEDYSSLEHSNLDVNSKLESEYKNLKENYAFLNSILEDKFQNFENESSPENSSLDNSVKTVNNIDLEEKIPELESRNMNLKKNYTFLNSIMKDKFQNSGNNRSSSSKKVSLGDNYNLEDDNKKLKEINSDLNEKYSKFEMEYTNLKKNYSDLTIANEKLFKENSVLKKVNNELEKEYSGDESLGSVNIIKKESFTIIDDSTFKTDENIVELDDQPKNFAKEDVDGFRTDSAAMGLSKLLEHIELNVPFTLDDLKDNVDDYSLSQFINYIGDLKELELLIYREDSDDYILRSTKQLYDFCTKYGISISLITMNMKEDDNTLIESSKECGECKKVLPISKFVETDSGSDGYSDVCKECNRSRNAAMDLPKLLEYIELDVPFTNDDLKKRVDQDSFFEVINHIWQLMELDLISQEDSNNYILKSTPELKDFCTKYGISLD